MIKFLTLVIFLSSIVSLGFTSIGQAKSKYSKVQFGVVREANFYLVKHYNFRDPHFPKFDLVDNSPVNKEYWDYGVGLELNTTLLKAKDFSIYWDQRVWGDSTNRQFRRTHWEFEVGISLGAGINFFHYHKSEHAFELDRNSYPLQDFFGFKFCFFGKGCNK